MEITRSNLEELLPEIERVISEAEFLAVDGEFTGLRSGENVYPHDSPARQYAKLRRGMDFLLVQFGLCAFRHHPVENRYTHRAYNFYVFPRLLNRSSFDPCFSCQSSCMNFLASHRFDFNKLFKDGIPYMTQGEEQRQRERLREQERQLLAPQRSEPVPIPHNLQDTVKHLCGLVEDFLAGEDGPELRLPACNGFVRKLMHQEVERRYPRGEVVLEGRQEGGDRMLFALRAGSAERQQRLQEEGLQKKRDQLDQSLGFSKVLRLVSSSGKLVVGHNMLLDLCHSLHQFVDPLPPDYLGFKEMASFVFPKVLDTKLMSASPPFKEKIGVNVLQNLYTTLCEEPFSMPAVEAACERVGYSAGQDKCHEAAYDAYLTGLCFLSMAHYLGSQDSSSTQPVSSSSPLLAPYVNKLNLLRSVDSAYINLSGDDPKVSTSHIFYVSFPKEWKASDLSELFSPFGSVQIWWVSDVSAWVALARRDQARIVRTTLSQSDRYAVVTHATYQQHEEQCGCDTLSARNIKLCLKRAQALGARSPIALKRRSQELVCEEQVPGSDAPKRRRSHSFGERSFSKRSFAPILEEQDEETDQQDEATEQNGACAEEQDHEEDAASGGRAPTQDGRAPTQGGPTKQFAECDAWD